MPRSCSICAHLDRGRIDQDLAGEQSLGTIASRFGVTKSALFRHSRGHHGDHHHADKAETIVTQVENAAAKVEQASQDRVEVDVGKEIRSHGPQKTDQDSVRPQKLRLSFTGFHSRRPVIEAGVVIPEPGKKQGPCPSCGCKLWRLRLDGSLVCSICRPLPCR